MNSSDKILKAKDDVAELMKSMTNNTKSILSVYEKMTQEQTSYQEAVKEVIKSYEDTLLHSPMALNELLDLAIYTAKQEKVNDDVFKLINKDYGIHILETSTYEEFINIYEVIKAKGLKRQCEELEEAIMTHGLYIPQLKEQVTESLDVRELVNTYLKYFGFDVIRVNSDLETKITDTILNEFDVSEDDTEPKATSRLVKNDLLLINILTIAKDCNTSWDAMLMHNSVPTHTIEELIHNTFYMAMGNVRISYVLGIYCSLIAGHRYDNHYKLDKIFVDMLPITSLISCLDIIPEEHRLSMIEAIAIKDGLNNHEWMSILSKYSVSEKTFRLIKNRVFLHTREAYEHVILPELSLINKWKYNRI